jgi:hypothetical protein
VQQQKLRSFATNRSEAELGEAKSRLGGAKTKDEPFNFIVM